MIMSKSKFFLKGAFFIIFLVSLTRVHFRVQTTMIGYELGQLKDNEAKLLEQRSYLKMEIAKLTTKSRLTMVASSEDHLSKKSGTLASR